ncbi:MAG: VanW family protein [Lachnospiraceae bacterium]|nr:VanW family protein [Lachnospiraceae bacterium]
MKKKSKGILICITVIALVLTGIMPMQAQAKGKTDYSAVFDADYYYSTYSDIRAVIGNDSKALLDHFVSFGMQEGRRGNAEFDVKAYMENNPDLTQILGAEDYESYYLHYISTGKAEGRSAVSGGANGNAAASEQSLIATYTTSFNPKQSRAVNIGLAASKINGTVVRPGQEFSFSDTVGPRTVENGFVMATTFVNKQEVPGLGGGICQVSSTMYAAMLQGGITATQRHAHSLPVSYIPEGMDATISAGTKDLTFTNDFDFPIVINAVVTNGKVTVSFSK